MIARFRKDPLVGNVLGLVALFIALGAGAYAAGLAPNSVKSKHIKDGQVKENDLGVESVTNTALGLNSVASENVVDNDLAGADIDEDGLGSVPNADAAENADLLDNKDSTAFQEVGSEGWTNLRSQRRRRRRSPAAGQLPWVGSADPSYFRDRDGVVHLRGVVKANDGTLHSAAPPPGSTSHRSRRRDSCRVPPGEQVAVHRDPNNKPARVDVFANGFDRCITAATPRTPT